MAGFLIPLIALAAGAGLQAAGAQQSREAMSRRTNQELARQRKIQSDAAARYSQSLQQSTPEVAQSQIQEGKQQALSGYKDLQATGIGGSQPKTDVVTQTRNDAETNRSNQARSALAAYPWWTLGQAVKDIRAGQDLGMLNAQAQRSQALLPMELQSASHAGDTLSGLGSLVGTIGSLYGMSGALKGASSVASQGASMSPNSSYGFFLL